MKKEKICGIYCIENQINHKIYIGQSINIYRRWQSHRCYLRRNKHTNEHLQNAWNKYGEENFNFYILKTCTKEELDSFEIYYIKLYDSYTNGYNRDQGGFYQFRALADETKEKILKTKSSYSAEEKLLHHQRMVDAHTFESIEIYQIDLQGNIINTWKSQRYAARELNYDQCCIWECVNHKRLTYMGFIWISTEEYNKNNFDLNNYINKNTQSRKINQYDFDWNLIHVWNSANEASRHGFDCSNIIKCCKNKIKYHKGFIFQYA